MPNSNSTLVITVKVKTKYNRTPISKIYFHTKFYDSVLCEASPILATAKVDKEIGKKYMLQSVCIA